MGVRSSCDMLARNSLLAWLAASAVCMAFSVLGALADAFFEQIADAGGFLSADTPFPRSCWLKLSPRYSISSSVGLTWMGSNLPSRTDVIPCCKSESGRPKARMVKREMTPAMTTTNGDHQHGLQDVEGVAADVPQDDQHHHPHEQQNDEERELGRQRTEIGRLGLAHVSMVPFSPPKHYREDTLVPVGFPRRRARVPASTCKRCYAVQSVLAPGDLVVRNSP